MKSALNYAIIFILIVLSACGSESVIENKDYKELIESAFIERKAIALAREDALFSVFKKKLSANQSDALKFLYAFMPLNDLADYDGDFFLANIDKSLRARSETAWGMSIPSEIFLHYVLPCRVNNENLDSFRIFYYDQIHDRIKGMNMKEAALEINHWCHEKVNYQPADIRTSAPMSTILSARGRCGEESTFTVAALRTAGIPARQVYTPRWAHSDDNHAWVEIWFEGEWYYMGACEPEPVLDRGWFTEPARRSMLVHTKSFGAPYGNENYINKYRLFSEVNNLSKYAVTKRIFVKVLDNRGQPSVNAHVEYKLYNYAEFYPLATVITDSKGLSQLETGLGDLLIWATDGEKFDFQKVSVSETDTLILKLTRDGSEQFSIDLDLDVPVLRTPLPGPATELIEANAKRVQQENSIIKSYINSWITKRQIDSIAICLNIDSLRLRKIFGKSMGNYSEVANFLNGTQDSLKNIALDLLDIVSDKDLRDTKSRILTDHLSSQYNSYIYKGINGYRFFLDYILNPRIANEIIVEWRSYFKSKLPSDLKSSASNDPSQIIKYLDETIRITADENYYGTPITPRGVLDLKVSDEESRAICFVAICRSLLIPARLEPGSNRPQYFFKDMWNDVYFANQQKPQSVKGYIKFKTDGSKPVPEYYIHFTIAKLENGRYNTLEYDYNKKVTDFSEELTLTPGSYILVTGNRLSDSKILSEISFFQLAENEHLILNVNLRKDMSERRILGKADIKGIRALFFSDNLPGGIINKAGTVVLWIEPDREPTKHIFNDLPLLRSELDKWGGDFLFLSSSNNSNSVMKPESLEGLPANSYFGVDDKFVLLKDLKIVDTKDLSYPYIILCDDAGNISFSSTGYRIGLGEQILKFIKE